MVEKMRHNVKALNVPQYYSTRFDKGTVFTFSIVYILMCFAVNQK